MEFYAPWNNTSIRSPNPMNTEASRNGMMHSITCPNVRCSKEVLEYQPSGGERIQVYPNQSDLTLNVVVTLVIEIEDIRRRANGEPGMTDSEKEERRRDDTVVDKAKALIHAAAASAMGGAAASAIAGLLEQL